MSSKKSKSSYKGIVKNGNANSKTTEETPAPQRSIFGDWTGKTPVSLLHEHCQKSNWEKPEYDTKRQKQGFLGTVKLGQRNKKTAQMQTVSLTPPPEFILPTAVEAKHMAATYALHRVKSHMPLQRVLPPQHRDYWKQFEQLKTASNAWQYEPDPFNAHPPMTVTKKTRSVPTKEHAAAAVPMPTAPQKQEPVMSEKALKDWMDLPAVHMNLENRQQVEQLIKESKIAYRPLAKKHTKKERMDLSQELSKMGFRSAHIDEALDYSPDKETALDWLCLHVPEDDLPPHFMLSTYNPTMTTIAHTTESLERDWLLKKMCAIGYPENVCKEALEISNGDESRALELLQWRLCHGEEDLPEQTTEGLEEINDSREDEKVALESIYGPFRQETEKDGRVVYSFSLNLKMKPVLQIIIPAYSTYPLCLPLFTIEWPGLPGYLKLAMIKGLVQEAELHLGMPSIYMCIEWLQEHAERLIAHPPKLRDLSEQLVTLETHKPSTPKRARKRAPPALPTGNSDELKQALEARLASKAYAPMGQVRSQLPAHGFKTNVVSAVLANQVTIVSGETGCGKTTQVPQFIMDEEIMRGRGGACNMICTQPRKISAIGVAERVAAERCESIGGTVGYAIRGETRISTETRLQFVTTGVLLRRIQNDPELKGVSHVMIDEVHERSIDSDFLLIILRKVLEKRKDLKVVLMSATLNQALFSDYFGGVPVIEIPGFTHPVQDFFLEDILSRVNNQPRQEFSEDRVIQAEWAEWQIPYLKQGFSEPIVRLLSRYRKYQKADYDLVGRLVRHIIDHEEAQDFKPAILIFMPGALEIKNCIDAIEEVVGGPEVEILPLHANLSPQEQTRVFKKVPDHVRKIVVATNVAETSITIEGVVYVIDSGRVKETQFEAANNMVHLVEAWASKASCRQRRGRAGRTRPGQCFKLFTRDTHEDKMRAQQVPELLRTPLEQLCLTIKAMGQEDLRAFLSQAIDRPSTAALDSAIKSLRQVEAIDKEDQLTALGKHMANIPADLRISKMLIYGSVFGCLGSILTIASTMSLKSPFTSPMEKREEAKSAREKFDLNKSDWLADMKAYDMWYETISSKGMKATRQFCQDNYLSFTTLNEIQNLRRQYTEALQDIGFYRKSNKDQDVNSNNINLLKSIIFAGLNPNVAKIKLPNTKYDKILSGTVEREKEAKEIKYFTKDDGRVFLHPSSLLFTNNSYQSSFLTYFSKMTTSKVFIRDGTEVPLYGILFFGGSIEVDHMGRGLRVGSEGWIRLRSWARIGVLVNQLKRLLSLELEYKIEDPDREVSVAHAIIPLITNDGV